MTSRYITVDGRKRYLISTSHTKAAATVTARHYNGIVRKLTPSQKKYEGANYGVYGGGLI